MNLQQPKPSKPTVLNRVKAPHGRPGRFLFGVIVPRTNGTIICDGRARRVIQVDPKTVQYA